MDPAFVGPYALLEKLGTGGMGEVYLAHDSRLHRKVALKRLSSTHLGGAGARSWLLHEARAAATLTHPNIAAIFDVIDSGDEAWIVMEYVPGETLRDRLRRGTPPIADVVSIGLQLADALIEAHAHGVIHRDLTPSNIRLTAEGKVKILDFGVATVPPPPFDPDAATTAESDTVGERAAAFHTPAYASPEQLLGQRADQRSDVYSVGVVLFELLTGRRLHEAADRPGGALATLMQAAPDPASIVPDVPAGLSAIVRRALELDRDRRFQSALELRAALQAVGTGSHASSGSGVSPAAPPADLAAASGRRRLMAVAGALALLAVALIGWPWWSRARDGPRAAPGPTVAVLPLANLSGNPANDYLGIGVADALVSALARLPGVTVVSRAPASVLSGGRDLIRIARELGVSVMVDGGVQRSEQELKLTVRTVRPDGSVAWAGSYEGAYADLFAIQRRLAEGVSEALDVRLTSVERRKLDAPPTSNVEAFAEYAQARALLDRPDEAGSLDRTVALFSSAVKRDRTFALAHAGLGEAYWARYQQTKDPAWTVRARDATLEALRLDPSQDAVRHSLAVMYRGTGDTERAMEELGRELALRPTADEAHRLLGEILSDKGDIDAAARAFREAIALRPNYWGHHDALGLAFYRAGRFAEAAAAFERVTDIEPDNARGFQRLGSTYQTMGDDARALANYQRANAITPTRQAHANIGLIYYRQRRFAESAAAYERAIAIDPTSHTTYANLADVYRRIGRRLEAQEAYDKAVELTGRMLEVNARDAATLSWRALYQAKLGRRAEADREAAAAATLAPADWQVLYNKALVHAVGGQPEAALAALEQALARGASAQVARKDDDLQVIRGTPEFERLTALGR